MSAILKQENMRAPVGLVTLRDMVAGAVGRLAGSRSYDTVARKHETSDMRVISMPADLIEQA